MSAFGTLEVDKEGFAESQVVVVVGGKGDRLSVDFEDVDGGNNGSAMGDGDEAEK